MMIYILEQIGSTNAAGLHLGLYKERNKAEIKKEQLTLQQDIKAYIKTYPLSDKELSNMKDNIYELQFKDDNQCMTLGFYAKEENAYKAKEHYMKKTLFENKDEYLRILTHHL